MGKLKTDLQAVTKGLKALTKKTERLMKAVDKLEKAQAAKKPKAKSKAAVAKRKAARKPPAKKKATKLTATDQLLNLIKRSKKGADVPTLIKKTGFDVRKVRNIVFRTFKQGRIKRTGKGIYVAA